MAGLILSPIEENKFLTGHEFQRSTLTVGDMALTSMARTLRFSPTDSLSRMLELNNIQTQHLRAPTGEGNFVRKMTGVAATEKYGIPGQLSFDQDVIEGVAALLNKRKAEEMFQDLVLSKAEGSQRLGLLGLDLLASLLDPINVGSAFIPIVGQARYASMLTRYGTTRARALRGLIDGSVGNAMVEPVVFSTAKAEQANYTEIDTLMNITFGGLIGTGLHVTFGRIGDSIRGISQRSHAQAVKTSVNQMAQGGQVEVEPILGSDNLNTVENVNIVDLDGATTVEIDSTSGFGVETTVADLKSELARRKKTLFDITKMQKSGFPDDAIIDRILGGGDHTTQTVQGLLDYANERIKFTTDLLNKAVKASSVEVSEGETSLSEKLTPPDAIDPIMSDGPGEYSDLYHSGTRLEEAINVENLDGTGEINLGSQIGEVMIDKANNKKYYVKTPESPVHAANEFATALFYKSLGANIPGVRLVMENRRIKGVASELLEDLKTFPYDKIDQFIVDNPDQYGRFMSTIVFDAWLGNRDAYAKGNLFIDTNNEIIRLDFGGGLLFRAQGAEKTDFKAEVVELKTFKTANFESTKIWTSLPDEKLEEFLIRGVESIAGLDAIKISQIVGGSGLPIKQVKQIVSILTERRADILFKFKDKVDFDKADANFTEFFDSHNAMKHTKEATNAAKYTHVEQSAIADYQGSSFNTNSKLREAKGDLTSTIISPAKEKLIKNLDSAIQKTFLTAPVVVYRGGIPKNALITAQTPNGIKTPEDAQKLIGHVISDNAFLSTSLKRQTAIGFGGVSSKKVLLRIYLPSGHHGVVPNVEKTNFSESSSLKGEAEFILERGLPLQVIAAETLIGGAEGKIVLTVRPVSKSVQPMSPKSQVKMAKAYKDLASSAADDDVMEVEFMVALSEAFKTPDDSTLFRTMKSVTDDLEAEVSGLPDIDIADIDVINTAFNDVVKQIDAIKVGTMKAFKCVLGKI